MSSAAGRTIAVHFLPGDFLSKEFGRVDILVNNAAVVGARMVGTFPKRLTEDDFAGPQAKALREEYMGITTEIAEHFNVSSGLGRLRNFPNEKLREELSGIAYVVSKAALNAYTRIMAKKYPKIAINAVCPGHTATDLNGHTGVQTVEEGGRRPVAVALLPHGGPSGVLFHRGEVAAF
ncbi:hypothetical protein MLD38_010486 [Melastoma candidum]|uniref:Uncharacterized protein n=1 Tax=Melastoma candidum TaxID=119954 RepID=A0ACB9R0K1_9MYRT|nr:hypothetical protein MLD38_010486 [Melastoma candidum]